MPLAKQKLKQALRRTIGEPYVGKRLKTYRISQRLAAHRLSPSHVLDAGSEDATFVYWLADRYPQAKLQATDIDVAAIDACIKARPVRYAGRVDFRAGHFAELPGATFDLVTAFDVLEHISDDRAAVADLVVAMRPGGYLAVHVPRDQWTHLDGTVERVADADAWRINSGHVRMGYSQESMRSLLESAGLDIVEMDYWLRRRGVQAHGFYGRLEHPAPLRIFTIPATDVLKRLDVRRPAAEGNTVWALARKPGGERA